MGNVFTDQRFFSMPVEFVDSGSLRDIAPSAVKLYVALCHLAQKHTAVTLQFSNAELRDRARLDPKSIQTARRQLQEHRLIDFEKGALGVYIYILRNPQTGERLSPPTGRKGARRYYSAEKAKCPTPSQPSSFPETATPSEKFGDAASRSGFRCYTCKGTEFWTRGDGGDDRVCSRCHPDSRPPITAKDIGF
jgi:hypothetical protein